jgi:uncharacterized protein YpuA (DUF1002 family)
MSININYLKIPLYKLYHLDNADTFTGLTEEDLNHLKTEYTESELTAIIDSVKWAIQNENYDFSSLLPNLNHSNKDIYKFLCKLDRSLVKL